MPHRRVRVTVSDEALKHAEQRAGSLGCSSHSVLAEAMLLADKARPIPGLAARVAEVELRLKEAQRTRGQAALVKAREERWPEKDSKEAGPTQPSRLSDGEFDGLDAAIGACAVPSPTDDP